MAVLRIRLKTYDVRVTANIALNVLKLGGMDRTFNIPRHIPKEVVIGVIRSGRMGMTCKKYVRNMADARRISVRHLRRSMWEILFDFDLVQDVDLVLLGSFKRG